jgi:hypothetical protein
VIAWEFDLQLPVQSVPITTKVASFNPIHGEVYSIQHYVFNPVTFCACPNPGPGFPTPYVMGVFVFNDLMREVHFADIGGILIDKGAVVIVW